jgi:hypothetical protein
MLWITFGVLLACLLLIIYSVYSTERVQKAAEEQGLPSVYREKASASPIRSEPGVDSSAGKLKPLEEQAEEAGLLKIMEEGLN